MAFVIKPNMKCMDCKNEWKELDLVVIKVVKCGFCDSNNTKPIKE